MKRSFLYLLFPCMFALSVWASPGERPVGNSIYYWRTTFQVTDSEQAFLREHNIKRLYLRMFDVDVEQKEGVTTQPSPIASIQFKDAKNLQQTMALVDECVPTVFITLRALKAMQSDSQLYAKKLTERVLNMCSYHELSDKIKEVQLDCDWTATTEQAYFSFLEQVRTLLHEQGIELSATIRLHQLRSAVPPVDRGVLMMYNTGSFKHPKTKNSILDYADVYPYLKNYKGYDLPLDYAFPVFEWGIWFTDNVFQSIVRGLDYNNTEQFYTEDGVYYLVQRWVNCENLWLSPNDVVRREKASVETIEKVKKLLPFTEQTSIILYHLDENNLTNYTNYETNILFTRPSAR